MTLGDLIGNGTGDVEISGLAYSSRSVLPGDLFFCVRGFKRDGHDFAPDAVARGAVALVCERALGLGVPEVVVEDARAAMAPIAARFYHDPTAALRVVGITGTNGKTTTAFLVRAILEAGGLRCGLLGTVASIVGGREEPVERTTPEAIDLQATFRRMLDAGDRACAMEVSSHALELGRADGVHFACRVFTNLTQDHLDFHPDMEDYFLAKRRLFDRSGGPAIVNVDDEYGRRLAAELPGVTTYSVGGEADFRARDVDFDPAGSRFTCATPTGEIAMTTRLPGLFNVSNALAATAAGRALGVPLETIAEALAAADRVPGRFEPIDEGQPFAVLVDYAHTPDSLENVLRAARDIARGRLIVVFGAGGDRDRGKRPLMGRVAAALADRVIVTSDNPRSEDPHSIVRQILDGAGPDAEREVDRRRAIAAAVAGAQEGDVVVIAGKGHEQGQEFEDGRKEPFDDVTVAREALRETLGSATVIDMAAEWVASAAGGRLAAGRPDEPGPRRAMVDSREAGEGDLFVGLPGSRTDGGEFAAQALAAGAWGALVAPARAQELAGGGRPVIAADDPLAALQALATAWRRELGCAVVGITGSTGKTSTKDILAALLRLRWPRTHANRENFNTEIGLPLTVLAAERGTEAMVLEMAMRGAGQIAELTAIAEPDVGVIVNVGPVHLELLGTVERVAAAKAELIRDLRPGAACVVPAGEPLLEPAPARRPRHDHVRRGRRRAPRLASPGVRRSSTRGAPRCPSSCPTRSPTTCSTRSPRWPPRRRSGWSREAAWRWASPPSAGRSWSWAAALRS